MTLPRRTVVAFGRVPFVLSWLAITAIFAGLLVPPMQPPAAVGVPVLVGLLCYTLALMTAVTFGASRRDGSWVPTGFFVLATIATLEWPAIRYYLVTDPTTVVVGAVGTDDFDRAEVLVRSRSASRSCSVWRCCPSSPRSPKAYLRSGPTNDVWPAHARLSSPAGYPVRAVVGR